MSYQLTESTVIIRLADRAFIPADPDNSDYAIYLKWVAEGNTPQPADVPQVSLEDAVVAAVQKRLDDFAKTRGYDGILSLSTYCTSTISKFALEGQRGVDLRDAHWAACYQILADVQSGARPVPTLDEILSEMPALTWPA